MTADGGDPGPVLGPTLGVAAVARRIGVATGTLRTWDRRYGVGPSGHRSGARRRYTAEDVARLEAMHRLMLEGVSTSEAARLVVAGAGPTPPIRTQPGPTPRTGGGRVVPLGRTSPAVRGLARAAMSLNADACEDLLRTALHRQGAADVWERLLAPVLAGIEERRRTTGRGLEVERLLTERAESVLRATAPRATAASLGLRPVLLAGVSEERHRLPLVALESALAERGMPVRMLGVRLPMAALADAVGRLGPAAVLLWSRLPDASAPVPGPEVMARVRPRPALVLAGPGYRSERWHSGVTWAGTLPDVVAAVLDRVGAGEKLTIGP